MIDTKKYKRELKKCAALDDIEMAHCDADKIGYGDIVEVYESIDKWYA